jgi:hypothetical protein
MMAEVGLLRLSWAPSAKATAGLTVSCLAHSDVVGREADSGKHMGSRRTAFSSDPVRQNVGAAANARRISGFKGNPSIAHGRRANGPLTRLIL